MIPLLTTFTAVEHRAPAVESVLVKAAWQRKYIAQFALNQTIETTLTMLRNTSPSDTDLLAVAEMIPRTAPFMLDPNLSLEALLAMPLVPAYNTPSFFVTPQTVRTTGVVVDSYAPAAEHSTTATLFAEGLNGIVKNVIAGETMTAAEIAYVLETFTMAFKSGVKM